MQINDPIAVPSTVDFSTIAIGGGFIAAGKHHVKLGPSVAFCFDDLGLPSFATNAQVYQRTVVEVTFAA